MNESDATAGAGVASRSEADGDPTSRHGYISAKDRYLARLRRIEGQARGIHRMVEQEQYCIDILTQISAMTSALRGVALGLLDDHLKHCVVDAAAAGGPEAEQKIKEASGEDVIAIEFTARELEDRIAPSGIKFW